MRASINRFFRQQVRLCRSFDRRVFGDMALDGNEAFVSLTRGLISGRLRVADIGGGKTPFFSSEEVEGLRLSVTGIDIDGDELARAPRGAYDATIVSPIERARGAHDHDLVIAQSVLEHVTDGRLAAEGIASYCAPGGTVVTFCPSRRAWFAQLNLLLPEKIKRSILFSVFPEKRERQGFRAYYDGCTPKELINNMRRAGVTCVEVRPYFVSSYFMFFFPLYLVWRLLTFPLMALWPRAFCETFIYVGTISQQQ